MDTWNKRLAAALAESPYTANRLASELGLSAPTISAWIGAGSISPAKDIKADNLLRVCAKLGVTPEWVMFKEGPMRPSKQWPFSVPFAEYEALDDSQKQMIDRVVSSLVNESWGRPPSSGEIGAPAAKKVARG